ncbi:ribosomal RNA small subunit methyltransferase I [Pararhodospirillum oryzae]|uniref:Ribosomal RNA small subunit methyltransferase I n=1 Tax=Pararhodospirillum oryzae TaxID=478448 RepID=A0A512H601_9PROT|nr:ribosomal RNA small subunit methyltransferase I [Pararhodospirillum oryzae]
MAPGLYVVGTPIGNRGDITARALDVLARADVVACEDTRVTGGLLHHLGIHARLTAYHEHNADSARPALLARLQAGQAVALVSDAGMPLVSDPGFKLVRACHEAGHMVTAAPGPSAVLTALALSGLPTDRFLFAGFPPSRPGRLATFCAEMAPIPATLVLFEGVSRLDRTLAALAQALGPREAAVCRELTKLHEEVRRAPLPDLAAHYATAGPPKGEAVIVIAPPAPAPPPEDEVIEDRLMALLDSGDSVREAAAHLARETGLPRRDLYRRALDLTREANDDADGDDETKDDSPAPRS